MTAVVAVVASALLLTCCSSGGDDHATTTAKRSATTTTSVEAKAESAMTKGILDAYPQASKHRDKILEWAGETCKEIKEGKPDSDLTLDALKRFAAGDKVGPSPGQTAGILEAIRSSGWCK
jgi:hypothetical protein